MAWSLLAFIVGLVGGYALYPVLNAPRRAHRHAVGDEIVYDDNAGIPTG